MANVRPAAVAAVRSRPAHAPSATSIDLRGRVRSMTVEAHATPEASAFRYVKPEFKTGHPTSVISLARTDRMWARVQVHSKGGEIGLHAHKHLDGFWMVLKGHARFYGDGDVIIADAGPNEGVFLPRGYRYRF